MNNFLAKIYFLEAENHGFIMVSKCLRLKNCCIKSWLLAGMKWYELIWPFYSQYGHFEPKNREVELLPPIRIFQNFVRNNPRKNIFQNRKIFRCHWHQQICKFSSLPRCILKAYQIWCFLALKVEFFFIGNSVILK